MNIFQYSGIPRGAEVGLALSVCFTFSLLAQNAAAAVSVDCGASETIANGITTAISTGDLAVDFQGTCVEDLVIVTDDLTIKGSAGSSTLQGRISVDGAQRVVLDTMIVTNSTGDGIQVRRNAAATIKDTTVSDHTHTGILVEQGSYAEIKDCIIENNGSDGIRIIGSSSADVSNTTLTGNSEDGLTVQDASFGLLQFLTVTGNTRQGINAVRSAAMEVRDSTVTDNGSWQIGSHENSIARLEGNTVTADTPQGTSGGALLVTRSALIRLRGINQIESLSGHQTAGLALSMSTIGVDDLRPGLVVVGNLVAKEDSAIRFTEAADVDGNVILMEDSVAQFFVTTVTISGQVVCQDEESFMVYNGTPPFTVSGCPGF